MQNYSISGKNDLGKQNNSGNTAPTANGRKRAFSWVCPHLCPKKTVRPGDRRAFCAYFMILLARLVSMSIGAGTSLFACFKSLSKF